MTLDQDAVKIRPDATFFLNATVMPADATDQTVVWTSSDEKVITVENGVVTAVGVGKATVTATLETQFDSIVFVEQCEFSVMTEPEIKAVSVMDMSAFGAVADYAGEVGWTACGTRVLADDILDGIMPLEEAVECLTSEERKEAKDRCKNWLDEKNKNDIEK